MQVSDLLLHIDGVEGRVVCRSRQAFLQSPISSSTDPVEQSGMWSSSVGEGHCAQMLSWVFAPKQVKKLLCSAKLTTGLSNAWSASPTHHLTK